jgi:hypothetical protein
LDYIMQHIYAHFTSSFLLLFVAGWLLSTHCVPDTYCKIISQKIAWISVAGSKKPRKFL